jgi:hypothetical protein
MAGQGLVLQAVRGDRPVGSYEVTEGPVSIGSWSGATLSLDDAQLHPVHVVLDPEPEGRWRLIALSPEGCLVNGRQTRRAWVTRGDRITIGTYELVMVNEGRVAVDLPTSSSRPLARTGSGELPLQATLRWRGTAIARRVLTPGDVLTVGSHKDATFELPLDGVKRFGAAAIVNGGWHVALDAPLRVLDITSGEHPLLTDAHTSTSPRLPRGVAGGKTWAPFPDGSRLRFDAGDLTIDLERTGLFTLERIARLPFWVRTEGQQTIIGLLIFLCLLAMIALTPRDFFKEQEDNIQIRQRLAEFKPKPITPEMEKTVRRLAKKQDQVEDAGAAKHSGDEGQSGKPNAPDRNTRSSRTNEQVVADNSLLRMLDSGATSRLMNGGALGSVDAIGHLDGSSASDASGSLGLGMRGNGPGGGGLSNDTVGVGPVGSKGPGLGTASKVGTIKGRPGGSDLSIDEPANVSGGLDREVIRRVILSHRAQIRYCYEKQLSAKPDLAGKVLVEFVIAADGSVTTARPTEQTLQDPEVGRCIVSKIKGWTFPKPKGDGVVVVTYPFLFKPAGQGTQQ